jgi:hypothetical protein
LVRLQKLELLSGLCYCPKTSAHLRCALGTGCSGGQQIGHLSGHCHIVAKQSEREWVAVCTKHYDWFDGSTMTAHATETVGPDNKRITEKLVIAGGYHVLNFGFVPV